MKSYKALGENCIKILSDNSNSLAMFFRIQSDIFVAELFAVNDIAITSIIFTVHNKTITKYIFAKFIYFL